MRVRVRVREHVRPAREEKRVQVWLVEQRPPLVRPVQLVQLVQGIRD